MIKGKNAMLGNKNIGEKRSDMKNKTEFNNKGFVHKI